MGGLFDWEKVFEALSLVAVSFSSNGACVSDLESGDSVLPSLFVRNLSPVLNFGLCLFVENWKGRSGRRTLPLSVKNDCRTVDEPEAVDRMAGPETLLIVVRKTGQMSGRLDVDESACPGRIPIVSHLALIASQQLVGGNRVRDHVLVKGIDWILGKRFLRK